jgi:hypothetical protein
MQELKSLAEPDRKTALDPYPIHHARGCGVAD